MLSCYTKSFDKDRFFTFFTFSPPYSHIKNNSFSLSNFEQSVKKEKPHSCIIGG